MNGNPIVVGHTRLIVSAILALGIVCAICGAFLIWHGYTGDILLSGTISAISGLCGFLGGKGMANMMQPQPDITVTGSPPRVEVSQQPTEKKEP